ncbi:hypothetical protein LMED105_03787 [Limnobacter sp. MED105]|nr:hypothetical protein LMED105_03787 [Limnobacter sp. MED105]
MKKFWEAIQQWSVALLASVVLYEVFAA